MTDDWLERFSGERAELNEVVMKYAGKQIKRFYNIDHQTYQDGVLPARTKELLGLVASLVLRCDDCVNYHLIRCYDEGVTSEEIEEVMAVGLVVGGSIVIPHLRRAFRVWDTLVNSEEERETGR